VFNGNRLQFHALEDTRNSASFDISGVRIGIIFIVFFKISICSRGLFDIVLTMVGCVVILEKFNQGE
jgi:hypothetical protein